MLMAVACCSMLTLKASANGPAPTYWFKSRQLFGGSENLGLMQLEWIFPQPLPWSPNIAAGTYNLKYLPAAGYFFVRWETIAPAVTFSDPGANPTQVKFAAGAVGGTIVAVYQQTGLSVGGVLMPTNTSMVLAPYLAAIGLIATTAAIALKKRKA